MSAAVERTTSVRNGSICAACQGPAKLACSGCRLVVYCSRDCQVAHRSHHKEWCASPLAKATWKPNWVVENRAPYFVGNTGSTPVQVKYGGKKYLWGNVPALDIIQLKSNEGENYPKDTNLLFAASGDLRNVVKSLGSLPQQYTQKTALFLNDLEFGVVARNLIITLVGLSIEDPVEAVPCMLHLWYSALIRQCDSDILTSTILPLFQDINHKIKDKPPGLVLGKTWKIGKSTCRAELTKEKWNELLSLVQQTKGLSAEQAHSIRRTVTLAPERIDHRDRFLFSQLAEHRLCVIRFWEDGLLLPFGASRETFVVPNPTFFQSTEWPMMDSAGPLSGWDFPGILSTDSGPAEADLYGKLFYHVSKHLANFHKRLQTHAAEFNLLNVNAEALKVQPLLVGKSFARIEVSNISDGGYLGTGKMLAYLGVMLQDTTENPYATLLALYMNAVEEAVRREDPSSRRKNRELETKRAGTLSNISGMMAMPSRYSAQFLQLVDAADSFRDFDRYMELLDFKQLEALTHEFVAGGITMKQDHTIVEKWPLRLKLRPEQPGAKSEWNVLQASSHSGCERYVEWKRGG